MPKEHHEKLESLPENGITTVLQLFKAAAAKNAKHDFMGTRDQNQASKPYVWKTWQEIHDLVDQLGRGMFKLNLCPPTQGEEEGDNSWRFVGIHSRNRYEWAATQLAGMSFRTTTVGFYDSLGAEAIAFIVNQTEMSTVFCGKESVKKFIDMKIAGTIPSLKNIVCFDDFEDPHVMEAKNCDLQLYLFSQVVKEGADASISADM